MGYLTGRISAPVSIYDVQKCFGLGSGDTGTLITNANINKWAKYKPIVRPTIDTVTGQWDAANGQWLSTANWWKGGDGHCGLTFTTFTDLGTLTNANSFLYKLYNLQLPWTYTKPSGGSASPFRLHDFAQYIHDAVPVVGTLAGAGGTIYVPSTGSGTRILSLNYDAPAEGSENLSLADFSHNGVSFQNFYLAVLLVKGSRYILVSSTNTIGDNGSTVVEAEIGYSDVGTWQIIPFLSSVQITQQGQTQTGTYLSAGYDHLDTITIASSGTLEQIFASGTYSNTARTQIAFQVTLQNNNSASMTHSSGLTIYVYQTNEGASSGSGGTLVGQWAYNSSVTIPANGSYSLPNNIYISALGDYFCGTLNVTAPASGKMYWITARYNDGTSLDNEWIPVEEAIMPDL